MALAGVHLARAVRAWPMDFEHSERAQLYIDRVERFVRERVLPNEATYWDHGAPATTSSVAHPTIVDTLNAEGQGAGRVEPLSP